MGRFRKGAAFFASFFYRLHWPFMVLFSGSSSYLHGRAGGLDRDRTTEPI